MTAIRSKDETGKEYGFLVVQYRLPTKNGKAYWRCLCDACQGVCDATGTELRNGSKTHCGCQSAKREFPNVLGLQEQIKALTARIEALEVQATATAAITATALTGGPTFGTATAPVSAQTAGLLDDLVGIPATIDVQQVVAAIEAHDVGFKGPTQHSGPVQRIEEILALPFEQRHDPEALKKEIRELMHQESVAITDAKEENGGARYFDKELERRTNALATYSKKINNYHLNPKDL